MLIVPLLFVSTLFPQNNQMYHSLRVGDWREYAIQSPLSNLYGLLREGPLDTIMAEGHAYIKQLSHGPIAELATYVRVDEEGNVLYVHPDSGVEDTLIAFSEDVEMNESWKVSPGENWVGEVFGWKSGYTPVYGLPIVDSSNALIVEYRMDNTLYWSEHYVTGIGMVEYVGEGFVDHTLQRIKIGSDMYSSNSLLLPLDTINIDNERIEFTINEIEHQFTFYFSFDPNEYGWSSCTIGALQFWVAPRSEIYGIECTVYGGGINATSYTIQSIALDSNRYADILDDRYIEPINVFTDPIHFSGTFRADTLPTLMGLNPPGSLELMSVDSFAVSLIITDYTVGIDDKTGNVRPTSFATVYPNPFNNSTRFQFTIKTPGTYKITIYDILGRPVWWKEEYVTGNSWELTWTGTDFQGRELPGGIFIAAFEGGGVLQRIKLCFLK